VMSRPANRTTFAGGGEPAGAAQPAGQRQRGDRPDRRVASLRRVLAAFAVPSAALLTASRCPCRRRSAPAGGHRMPALDGARHKRRHVSGGAPASSSTWRLPMTDPVARMTAAPVSSNELRAGSAAACLRKPVRVLVPRQVQRRIRRVHVRRPRCDSTRAAPRTKAIRATRSGVITRTGERIE
jgi:hypothetical protein